ncbi:uncharacterized protein LOC108140865 [Drosophila elegans]|uniref:uncharacterized protein LOC108140865 n=1 Tax=Drosophila elegans TaxID=30023 RepID=UPI0007E840E5|nr:uncharacterized protein LOC108140865 [Drosophila elegans]
MNAAVCVVVTVPTEAEELRLNSCCLSCGGSLKGKPLGQLPQCERCHRLDQMAGEALTIPPPDRQSRALQLRDLRQDASLEQLLRAIAEELRLEDVFWSQDVAGRQLQARFDLPQDERYERLLCTLQDWGVGERPGTHVSETRTQTRTRTRIRTKPPHPDQHCPPQQQEQQQQQAQGWQSFMDSVRCRLNVNQVVRQVRRDATLTFDFVVLLLAAALLSCVGLVENSFLFLSSSMLISPLMGPIIAAIFGSVIGDRELQWLGLRNELLGIAVSVLIGFVFGALVCGFGHFFAISAGLTEEIVSRCDTHSLAIGVCTALASGAAGAIAVLGGNTGSLVGVAISASLLPPAVNAGLLWALAIGCHWLATDNELLVSLQRHSTYSTRLPMELLICAAVSMALTLLNIVCVWLMGVVVLRIKEVAPAVERHQQFWRHDVRTAREVALLDPDLQEAIDRLDEGSQLGLARQAASATGLNGSADLDLDLDLGLGGSTREQADNYHTVHGFKEFCITLHRLKSAPKEAQLPRVVELFARGPEPHFGQTGTTTATNTATTTANTTNIAVGSGLSSCRSLPDIGSLSRRWPQRPASALSIHSVRSSPTSNGPVCTKRERRVHWREEQLERDILSGREGSPLRRTGQVLIPLPSLEQPDRPLQLLPYKRSEVTAQQDEFQA